MRYKRVLLIHMDYMFSVYSGDMFLDAGLGYVAEMIARNGVICKALDLSYYRNKQLPLDKIAEFSPDLIGFAMRSLNFKRNYKIINEVHEACPQARIVVGGPHLSTFKEKVLTDCAVVDYGVVHEGEETLLELCQGKPPEGISGLIYRNGAGIPVKNHERPWKKDLDNLPFPTYSAFDLYQYQPAVIPIVTSRGCPYSCIYCPVKTTIGRAYRERTAEYVVEEIEWWYKQGYREFDITDDNFTLHIERVYRFCDEVERRGLKQLKLNCGNGIRADRVNRQLLSRMKEVGFTILAFGVEAGNNRILKNIKKGETIEQIEQAIAWACELGFQVKVTFLIGSPGEKWADVQDSIRMALKYPVHKFNFFNLVPFPGTELYDWITANNYWLRDPSEHLNEVNHWNNVPAFETPELSREERVKAFEITHKLMKRHWGKVTRITHRSSLKKRLQTVGMPDWAAKLLANIYHNDLMPLIDLYMPVLGRFLRSIMTNLQFVYGQR